MKTSIRNYIFLAAVICIFIQLTVNTAYAAIPTADKTASGGFLNGTQVTFTYTGNYTCTPNSNTLLGKSNEVTNSQKVTQCEVGASALNQTGAFPFWVAVPAYAGLSIFGVPSLGATSQGFPTFHNQTIATDCGAGGTNSSCADHPTFLYSPDFTAVEKHLKITNGIFGLPEGVLPTPAHTHIVSTDVDQKSVPWYAITVLVFDPNIMPNAITGKCIQVVPSNITNATGNCLTSLAALERALVTQSSATAVNNNNPIWQTLGGPTAQVIIPGITMVTQINNDNTNLNLEFAVKNANYYAQFLEPTTIPTASKTASGGFLNGTQVTFTYTGNYTCSPNSGVLLGNSPEVANSEKVTQCEVGASALKQNGAFPLWVSVPAFSGLSIFGVPSLGATSQGFPTFHNQTIATDCGAGGTNSSCADHPTFLYSPDFTAVEKHLKITNGIFGLPEGVLPTPAHTHIVASTAGGAAVQWYAITVLVFDPNIMPDATTGKCSEMVPSNLTNPTGNCLTSLVALQRALVTSSSATAINGNNPIWQTLGGPTKQVIVPGVTMVTQLSNDNTNLDLDFAVKNANYYTQFLEPTTMSMASKLPSPVAQLAAGVQPANVKCPSGFYLMINNSDSRPACVTQNTMSVLEARGWGHTAP